MVKDKKVNAEVTPIFGVETEEVEELRSIVKLLRMYLNETDGISVNDLHEAMEKLDKKRRTKKRN